VFRARDTGQAPAGAGDGRRRRRKWVEGEVGALSRQTEQDLRAAVWFENGAVVRHQRERGPGFFDSLHPGRLRRDRRGHALPVALYAWDGPESLRMLTEGEAAAYWPDLAADLRLQGMLCPGAWFAVQEAAEAMAAAAR
jgi:hypothetical protein